jgi:hypothetical protein
MIGEKILLMEKRMWRKQVQFRFSIFTSIQFDQKSVETLKMAILCGKSAEWECKRNEEMG